MEKSAKYQWKYCSLGGAVRVDIQSGEDIARLGELDPKLWTIHSCPVGNVIFDKETLTIIDNDNDGRIRLDDVVATAQWVTSALRNKDLLLRKESEIAISEFDEQSEVGKLLADSARALLEKEGVEKETISMEDIEKFREGVADRANAAKEAAVIKAELASPFGENTAAAVEACNALRDKVADFFLRCKLVSFNEECRSAVDMSIDSITSVGNASLSEHGEVIAACPLARPDKGSLLSLNEGINPAWQAPMAKMKALVLDAEFPGAEAITEEQWNAVVSKMDGYLAEKAAIEASGAELLDGSVAAETALVEPLHKFIRLYRYFYEFLHNFVSFSELYGNLDNCVVNAGKLLIDQRCCELCVNVKDMSQHGEMAALSGMFLIYCDCVERVSGEKMQIVAALTAGSIRDIRVGKNAVFYDRQNRDWDATVTKVVENPINIKQAFWSPYRKFANWCSTQINKFASEKEGKSMDKLQGSVDISVSNMQAQAQNPAQPAAGAPQNKAFDIAKFAGIFAAIGMAIGFIGGFLVDAGKAFFSLPWWGMIVAIAGLMLIISGPSMFLAWSKLRHRNLAPILNANGWAVNTAIPINVPFGKYLTHMSSYPIGHFNDPFAEKKTPAWKKWLWIILVLLVAAGVFLYLTGRLAAFIG